MGEELEGDVIPFRASSWATFFDCPQRWYAEQILGKKKPYSSRAWLGTSVHHATGGYDQAVLDGEPDSMEAAIDRLNEKIHHPDEDVDWDDLTPRTAELAGRQIVARYTEVVAPKMKFTAVEAPCESLDVHFPHLKITIRLTGTLDRIYTVDRPRVEFIAAGQEGLPLCGVNDLKTSKRAVNKEGEVVGKGFAMQMGVYELIGEHIAGQRMTLPARITGLQTSGTARVGFSDIKAARDILVGTEEHPGAMEFAARMIKEGLFPGNPRSMMCSEDYCPAWDTCNFRDR